MRLHLWEQRQASPKISWVIPSPWIWGEGEIPQAHERPSPGPGRSQPSASWLGLARRSDARHGKGIRSPQQQALVPVQLAAHEMLCLHNYFVRETNISCLQGRGWALHWAMQRDRSWRRSLKLLSGSTACLMMGWGSHPLPGWWQTCRGLQPRTTPLRWFSLFIPVTLFLPCASCLCCFPDCSRPCPDCQALYLFDCDISSSLRKQRA